MDEEVNPDHENVNSVLAQDSIELFHILSSQSHSVIMELCQMMPSEAWHQYQVDPSSSSATARPELIKTMLDYFRSASARKCRNFLQRVCFSCENIPMLLESRLMSVAGYDNSYENSSPAVTDQNSSPPFLEQRLVKRPRIDHWQQYISEVEKCLLKRWKQLTAGLVREVQLENVWVSPRAANRSRDRPDQTPSSADRGGRTPEPDGDYGYLESRVTLETFLQGCLGKVTVLVGKTGSGKTLLTSCLGQQWGPVPSSFVFVLLEFRQLNLLSRPLSLSELLFQYYLPPTGGEDAKRAIIDYLLTNPEQSCWVLDGYDEFHSKLSKKEVQRKPLHLEDPLPVADLISGLLNRQILPGSTVLVTCRVRDLIDLDGISDKVGQLLGWDQDEIKEYVDNFFGAKALREQAAQLLLSSRHLLAMSSIPALCNICCICLEHLLLQWRDKATGGAPMPDEKGSKARTDAQEAEGAQMSREARGEEDVIMDGTNGRPQLAPTSPQVPATLTQVYLTVLGSFLSRDPNHGGDGRPKTKRFPHSAVTTLTILSQYQSELCELSRLAWTGLEESKILFLKEEIPQEVLKFSLRIGLLSQVELRRQDGILASAYCFIHLTVQEFLAALRIMTSNDVNDAQLKKRFSLKTRWTSKSDQKTVFTDSLYLYVCGLASSQCTPALVELAKVSGSVQSWVQKRQDLVLKLLKTMCNSNTLTGPKILQLCHSVQESQNHQLAKQVFGVRPKLELRNIWLLPNDIEALAFVVNSADQNDIGLDFGACSMELECLIVLARCQGIHNLSFHSRKYGDKFAEKLSSVLPKFTSLRKLEFSGASLTATGAASLASGLQGCPHITEINLSDNNLRDEGISYIAEIFTKLQNLSNVVLGRNSTTLNAVDCLIKTMSSCLNIQHVHADGIKDLTVTFFQKSDMNSLLNQNWNKSEMQKLAESLARCPALSVLDLSGGQWDEEILRKLTEFLPQFSITEKIIINDSCSSVEGLVVLTALLSDYPPVMELHIRYTHASNLSNHSSFASFSLSYCNLHPADLESVLRCLGTSSDLTMLDLSSNCLGNKGLKKLLDFLPRLCKIQEINASNNDINMEGVVMLAGALCSYNTLTEIHISGGGKEEVSLKFSPFIFFSRVKDSSILPSDMTKVCRKLVQSRFHWELELSQCSLTDEAIGNLLKVLPKMTSLQRLNVSQSITSAANALKLVSCLTDSQRVTSVELRYSEYFCGTHHTTGDHLKKLLEILQQGPQLSDLDLSSNQLEDEDVSSFVHSLPRLKISTYVNLSNNRLTQQGLLAVANTLCTCANVSGVEVSLGEEEQCFIWFRQSETREKSLSLVDCAVNGYQLASIESVIPSCPFLTELDFSHNILGVEGAEFLCSNMNLYLGWCKMLHTVNKHLFTMELFCCSLSHCVLPGGLQLIEALGQCVILEDLCLDSVLLNEESRMCLARALRNINSICRLRLNEIVTAMDNFSVLDLLAATKGHTHLKEIELGGWRMACRGIEELNRLIPTWTELRKIKLSKNLISDQSGEKLLEALKDCSHLEELCLSDNTLGNLTAARMALIFPSLTHLSVLDISLNRIDHEGSDSLSKAIMCMKNLKKINLTSVGTSELCAVVASLAHCPLIQEVGLGWNNCRDEVALEVARVLPFCHTLTQIDLECNSLSVSGAEALLKALRFCPALQLIRLWKNKIFEGDVHRLALRDRRMNFSST
uniref:NACHT domain-containing protein n=1 Tax=Oreochromis niloticus TaxID=8128 RepID=I3JYV5_ORENI